MVYVSRFRKVTLFPVRENSERRFSLVVAVNCGIFQRANIPLHWKDFAIETALKMADSLISALKLIETHPLFVCDHTVPIKTN